MDTVRRKWRPTLSMIVFVVLVTVAMLPLIGLFFFRLYENQLIHQTESELIAQTAAIAAIYAREVEADPAARALAKPVRPYVATRDELRKSAADVFERVASGVLRVHVHRTFWLAEAQEAHRALESRGTTGKLLLQIR